jgi:tetratricopeptide (TPR) repeat protein
MPKKYSLKTLKSLFVFLFITCNLVCLSSYGYAQRVRHEEEEGETRDFSREAQVALVEADKFYRNNEYAKARAPLLQYLATEPEETPAVLYQMLATCWYLDGNPEEARKVYEEGYSAYPESEEIIYNYAAVSYELEDYRKAAQLFEKLYDVKKEKDLEMLYQAAVCYYTAEEFEEAVRVFEKMIDLSEQPESSWFETIISIYMEESNNDKAEEYILRALDIFPLMSKYWQLLASIRLDKSNFKGAASALEIGFTIEPPEERNQWANLLDLYNYLRVPLRTAKSLKTLMEMNAATEEDYIKIAQAYEATLRVDEAVSFLDSVISKNPSKKLLFEKAKILYDARRNKEAIKALDECLKVDPDNGYAYVLKGFAAWDMEDWKKMKEAFTMAQDFSEYKIQAREALAVIEDLERARSE